MTKNVQTVRMDDCISDVKEKIRETGHDGFPVCADGQLEGYITAKDIVSSNSECVKDVMRTEIPTIDPSTKTTSAGRVLFRKGKTEICVTDENGDLLGIISNTDIIRGAIERTTPTRIRRTKNLLKEVHGISSVNVTKQQIPVDELRPTQQEVLRNELEGREYELQNGLAEPIVVIDVDGMFVLVDGHHRSIAARQLGHRTLNAWVIELDEFVQLGMVKNAEKQGIYSVGDICITENGEHIVDELSE